MSQGTYQDSTRYVVDSDHPGGILAGKREEMGRDVYLEPGAAVHGGVFAEQLEVSAAPVIVNGAIHARKGIRVGGASAAQDNVATVTFGSAINAGGSFVIAEGFPSRVRVLGDIYADQLRLQNVFVRGNLFARNAILRDCVVLGGAFIEQGLRVEQSALTTFRAGSASLGSHVYLFYPLAFAHEEIGIESPVGSLALQDLAELRSKEFETTRVTYLDETDVFAISERGGEDGETTGMSVLSLAMRLLDIEPAREAFEKNLGFIKTLALADHLGPGTFSEDARSEMAEAEESLFEILAAPMPASTVPRTTLDEIAGRESTQEMIEVLRSSGGGDRT